MTVFTPHGVAYRCGQWHYRSAKATLGPNMLSSLACMSQIVAFAIPYLAASFDQSTSNLSIVRHALFRGISYHYEFYLQTSSLLVSH